MAEREIKTVLTLEDASFTKGLKAASNSVSAAKAEMNAAISSAGGLGKGLKQAAAQVKGLSNVVKAQKKQMGVLNKEYNTQKNRLNDLKKAAEAARKENGEGSKEAERATNAYAAQSAKVDDLRMKMANLTVEMNKNKDAMKDKLTAPLRAAGNLLKSFGKLAVGAFAAGGAALTKFTLDANESKKTFNTALADSRGTFGAWSLFLEEEAKKAWSSLGLSQAAYMQTSAEIGQKLQEGGASVQQSAEWVSRAMVLAGQLSKKYGIPVETVLNDIARAAEGDVTALGRYGVKVQGINDKMTKSEAASEILKEAMESAKSTAQTLDGNVAQSVNSAGVKLKAAWEDFKAGVGSSEDLASAAAEAAAAFGTDFASNLATFIHIAPGTFSSFANSFKLGWKKTVWPKIQGLFHAEFKIDLPDWETMKKNIEEGFDKIIESIPNAVRSLLGLPPLPQVFKNPVVEAAKAEPGTASENEHVKNIEALTKALNEVDTARGAQNVTQAVKALQTLLDTPQEKFLTKDQASRLRNGLKDATNIGDVIQFIFEAYNQISAALEDEKLLESQGKLTDSSGKASEALSTAASEANGAASNMESAGSAAENAADAFNSAADSFSDGAGWLEKNFRFYPNGFAGGLWNVPRNDYMARLHSGEMVLTASQAARYRAQAAAGGSVNNYNDSSAIYIDKYYQNSETDAQALLNAMSVMQRRQRRGYGMA